MSLQVRIKHSLGGFQLDVDFASPGGVTALFGRSGAGKTSVLNAVAGLLRPSVGHIQIGDQVLQSQARFVPPHRRQIGYVFQAPRLFPHLSVAGNLAYGRRFARKAQEGLCRDEVIALLGLEPLLGRRPEALSGGEAQRVALGRALLAAPRMLIMDEPLASLDAAHKAEILPYLEALKSRSGLPILYVSHAMDEIARLADTLVLMQRGRTPHVGPIEQLLADPALVPLIGVRDAGAVLEGIVTTQSPDGLAEITLPDGGTLYLPGVAAPISAAVRVRVLAQDIILSQDKPERLSALNILPVIIRKVQIGEGPGAAIALEAGGTALLARVTARSARAMGLTPGQRCYAVLKATSVAPFSIGHK